MFMSYNEDKTKENLIVLLKEESKRRKKDLINKFLVIKKYGSLRDARVQQLIEFCYYERIKGVKKCLDLK